MAKLPIDDIVKAVVKQLANKGNQKARYNLLQKTKGISTSGSSKVTAKPKVKPKVKASEKPTVSGKPVGRIAKTTPARPKRDYYAKGKTVPQTDAERRAAERMANRMLRKAGDTKPKSKPAGNAKPVDVRGSIVQPPSKATMRPPKPSKSSYEGDKSIAEIRADLEKFGRGQKVPKKAPKRNPKK
jgi:hypothetical protein